MICDCTFAQMVNTIRPRLRAAALRVLRNPADADDAVQDALALAFERRGQLRSLEALNGWLFAITRNASIASLRRRIPESPDFAFNSLPSADPGTEARLIRFERLKAICSQLDAIPSHYREILLLRLTLTCPAIADLTGLPLSTVKTRAARGLLLLRSRCLRPTLPAPVRASPSGKSASSG